MIPDDTLSRYIQLCEQRLYEQAELVAFDFVRPPEAREAMRGVARARPVWAWSADRTSIAHVSTSRFATVNHGSSRELPDSRQESGIDSICAYTRRE